MRRFFRVRDFTPDADRDLNEEIRAHLEFKVEELMANGYSEEDARAEAQRRFGDVERVRDEAASHARTELKRRGFLDRLETLAQDVRYAFRRMLRSPGFSAAAILSLAIGIGGSSAVFSVINAFLLRKAPFEAPEELVRIYTNYPHLGPYRSSAYQDFLSMREMNEVFEYLGATDNVITVVRVGDESVKVMVEGVSAGMLTAVGAEPDLGRDFLPDEDRVPGENPVVLLGHGFWERAFAGDPAILGRAIDVAGRPFTVIGVTPDWLQSTNIVGLSMDLYVPVTMSGGLAGASPSMYENRGSTNYSIVGRMADGVTFEEVRARLDLLAAQLQKAYPETNQDRSFTLLKSRDVTIDPELDGGIGFTAAFLLVVVGLVLLLVCTNLATFLLARGVERRKEVAVRLALGSARGRLVRQLLTETVLLGLVGGVVGLLIAHSALRFLMAYQPPFPVPISLNLDLDGSVFLFALGVSALSGLLFGLLPALQTTNPDLAPTLKDATPGAGRQAKWSLQRGLVTAQMAVSVVLLIGAGLFLRSLHAAESMDLGFSTEEAALAWVDLATSQVPREEWELFRLDLEERLSAQPGIREVTGGSRFPLSMRNSFQNFTIPEVDPPPGQEGHRIEYAQVAGSFFEVLGIPFLSGRSFTPDDRAEAPNVVVVSREFARKYWPEEDPLGKQFFRGANRTPLTVVGVVEDAKIESLGEEVRPVVYFHCAQFPTDNLHVMVRGTASEAEMVGTLRRIIAEVRPGLVVMEVKTMEGHLALRLFGPRAAGILLGLFGIIALLLSSIGLYGVVSFSVSRRTREMGIRMSLGADRKAVMGMVVRQAMRMVIVGGLIGVVAGLVLGRLVEAFLLVISPSDPITMVLVPVVLAGVAFVAAAIPARRVTRVNPVEALRTE